jgi:excisionase family DNA binding protein
MEPLISAKQAAHLLGIHIHKLRRLCRAGEIPYIRIGAVYRFRRSRLDAWITGLENAAFKGEEGVQDGQPKPRPR